MWDTERLLNLEASRMDVSFSISNQHICTFKHIAVRLYLKTDTKILQFGATVTSNTETMMSE